MSSGSGCELPNVLMYAATDLTKPTCNVVNAPLAHTCTCKHEGTPTKALAEPIPPLKVVQQGPCKVLGKLDAINSLGLAHVVKVRPALSQQQQRQQQHVQDTTGRTRSQCEPRATSGDECAQYKPKVQTD
jgi:hypothetical protein